MRRPRLTIRLAMLAVLAVALAFGLGYPAVQILSEQSPHIHNYMIVSPDGKQVTLACVFVPETFWPRYVRATSKAGRGGGSRFAGRVACSPSLTRSANSPSPGSSIGGPTGVW